MAPEDGFSRWARSEAPPLTSVAKLGVEVGCSNGNSVVGIRRSRRGLSSLGFVVQARAAHKRDGLHSTPFNPSYLQIRLCLLKP